MDDLEKKADRPATAAARRRLTGLKFPDESGQKNLLGKKGAHLCGCLAGGGDGVAPQPLDALNRPVHFAMSHCGARMLMIEFVQHFRQVARAGADIQDRGSDVQNIIDLTRMHQPHEAVPHHNNVKISRRQ